MPKVESRYFQLNRGQFLTEESIDGSGIALFPNSACVDAVLANNEGTQFCTIAVAAPYYQYVEDTNGNKMTFHCSVSPCSNFRIMTDTLGRTWTTTTGSTNVSGCPVAAANSTLWDTPGPNSTTREFKLCYSSVAISTSLPWFNNPYGLYQFSASEYFVTGVVLPDGTTWRFDYNAYGDLDLMEFLYHGE